MLELEKSARCSYCEKPSPPHACGRCFSAYYCGTNCQHSHYKDHKASCHDYNEKVVENLSPPPTTSIPEQDAVDLTKPVLAKCSGSGCNNMSAFHVELDCGHLLCMNCLIYDKNNKNNHDDVRRERSQQKCFVCHADSLPKQRIDKWILEKGKRLWDDSQHPAWKNSTANNDDEEKGPRKVLLWLAHRRLASLPNIDQFPESSPLVLLEKDVYWRNQVLLARVCLQLNLMLQADRLSQMLVEYASKPGWRGTVPLAEKEVEACLIKALVLEKQGKLSQACEELKRYETALRKKQQQNMVNAEIKAEFLLLLRRVEAGLDLPTASKFVQAVLSDRRLRQYPGINREIAKIHQQKGDIPNALMSIKSGIVHETMWNLSNQDDNVKMLCRLTEEMELAESQRREEEAFGKVWGDVLEACNKKNFDIDPTSWGDLRDMFNLQGGMESDDEDEFDEKVDETLNIAAMNALRLADNDESESHHETDAPAAPPREDMLTEVDANIDEEKADGEPENITYVDAVSSIKLTNDVLKWIKNADARFRGLFVKKVHRLARGERSHKLSKGLEGCQSKIFETYLENKSGHRILWTEDPEKGILIWYVSAHKKVSRYAGLVDNSEKRSSRPLTSASEALQLSQTDDQDSLFETGTVLLDPTRHVPLRLYEVPNDEFERLESTGWRPPLHLTPREKEIVETQGTVCILGRSGTGKTVCIANRIHHDRYNAHDNPEFSQLFIARSKRVCSYVRDTVGEDAQAENVDFWTYEKFLREAEVSLGCAARSEKANRMDFRRFKSEVFDANMKIDALVAWTQIRSFIKGSIQSVKHRRSLTKEEYFNLSERENRLEKYLRKIAYDVFESYDAYMKAKNLWDDTDRVRSIIIKLFEDQTTMTGMKRNRLYVDEIQDFTQSEIAMFFMCCDPGRLFLAGDSAQSVEEGVDFRFEDVRVVAYEMVENQRLRPEKPKLLKVNFRSHAGVLNLAAGILDIMFKAFPGSAKELPKDEGLFRGPRPALFVNLDFNGLRDLVRKQEGAVILTMNDSMVETLSTLFDDENVPVLSIRDSKGLEFDHVIIVDFFTGLQLKHQKGWKEMINGNETKFPEIELQLKQLYTAITRCCKRLLIAETGTSDALSTWKKWATIRRSKTDKKLWLLEEQDIDSAEQTFMTKDEWMTRGLLFASKAEEESDINDQEKWFEKSVGPFVQSGDEMMKSRAQQHLRSLRIRRSLSELGTASGLSGAQTNEADVASLVQGLVENGLAEEASRLCKEALRVIDEEAVSKLIAERLIKKLPNPEQ